MPTPVKVSNKCKKGEIERIGYVNKRNTKVSAECVKDRGLPGKTPENRKIPFHNLAFEMDDLGKYGYKNIINKSTKDRQEALSLAINNYGSLPVLRKINVLDILNRNANPKMATKLEADKIWLENKYDTNKSKK
jgi:hypothetical protein